MSLDLTGVIEDSVNDALLPEEPVTEVQSTEPVEQPVEQTETVETQSAQVDTPATKVEQPTESDDFDKQFGLTPNNELGRQNRIPYDRVKKISEKSANDREAKVRKEFEGWKEPKAYTELEAKVQDYEARLQNVANFENVLANQPEQFMQWLQQIPAYQPFFNAIRQLASGQQQAAPVVDSDPMPQPNSSLGDGTKVYDQAGLDALFAWKERQIVKKVETQNEERVRQLEARYKPIEDEWQAHQRYQQLVPKVQAQIEAARKWPLFNENEAEITQALQADRNLNLEGAYQKVVWPKMIADRNKIRDEVLSEIKQTPTSTATAPARTTKPNSTPVSKGAQSLESIIREATGLRE